MILTQGLLAFALWMSFGFVLYRRSRHILRWALKMPRRNRIILGPVLLIAGAAVTFAGIYTIQEMGGFTPRGMTRTAWVGVSLLGAVFVTSQVLAASLLVTLANVGVTKPVNSASVHSDKVPTNDA